MTTTYAGPPGPSEPFGPPSPARPTEAPPPPDRPAPPGTVESFRRRLPGRRSNAVLLAAVVAFGVLLDVAVMSLVGMWAVLVAVIVVVGGLLGSRAVTGPSATALALAAVPLAGLTVLRASAWVAVPALLMAATLVVLAASMPDGVPMWRRRPTDLVLQLFGCAAAIVLVPLRLVDAVADALPSGRGRTAPWAAVVRGLLLAVPLVLVVGALLAAGDDVFASFVDLDLDLGRFSSHAILIAIGVWLGAALFAQPKLRPPADERRRAMTVGALESGIVLGGLAGVYALFALAQVAVTLKGDDYVQATAGVTYAEYAREGFFPLLAAAAITAVVLLALRSATDLAGVTGRRAFTVLGLTTVALTLVLVQSALARLGRYDDAFGLTLLRLSVTAVAWWIGAAFVLIGISLVRVGERADWLAGALLCSAVAGLLVFGAVDPDRVVVERNLARHEEGGRFDDVYIGQMSADVVPPALDGLDRLRPVPRESLLDRLCDKRRPTAWTPSHQRAAEALERACPRR